MLEQSFGISRFCYNWALTERKARYERFKAGTKKLSELPNDQRLGWQSLRNGLTALRHKEGFDWLGVTDKNVRAEACRDLHDAFDRFFKGLKGKGPKVGYPKLKKKGKARFSCRITADVIKVRSSDRVKLGKLGEFDLCEPLIFEDGFNHRFKSATLSRSGGKYFVSFCIVYTPTVTIKSLNRGRSVGIDLGINASLTLSNGKTIHSPKPLRRSLKKLASLAKQHARKKKGGANRRKSAQRLARLHYKVVRQRQDFIEKTTTYLARKFDYFFFEDLNVRGMLKYHRLSRSIGDEAWSKIITALERKKEVFGLQVHKIDRFAPSSKTCFYCKSYRADLTLSDRTYGCEACKRTSDRDLNAARNILEIGRMTLGGAAAEAQVCGDLTSAYHSTSEDR